MFFKEKLIRLCVRSRFHTRRFISSDKSKDAEFSTRNATFVLPFESIPMARSLPLIGTKLDLIMSGFGKRLHEVIDNRHQTLGPIFREPVEGSAAHLIFLNSSEMMREMFIYEGKYPKHPLPDAWTLYNDVHSCKRGLFFMDDEEWLINRKIMNGILLRNDFQLAQSVIENVSDNLIHEWNCNFCEEENFAVVTGLMSSLYTWSIKVLVYLMIGETHGEKNHEINKLLPEFSLVVQKVFEHTAPLMIIPPTFARKYKLNIWHQFENSVTRTLEIANDIVDVGLKMNGNGLLKEMQAHNMSTEVIKRIFADLIIAAGDTTAYTTQWALFLLSTNVSEQSKIREQLDKSNFETPLIRGTVRESLRLFPVATFIGRILPVEGIIGNYRIPEHTPVIASMYSIGRDAENFPNPDKFNPSRWLRDTSGNLHGVYRPNMPYAIGVRSCVGQKLANSMMHTILSKILRNFELNLMNSNPVGVVMRLIAVPSAPIMLGIKRLSV
ncbi:Cytochrome P450, mitochondrial [Pseudolycoriella hygida]|uniref:Cytochrome P450, mitochondrial n=1 Tax=Pseudolycoriella hygida TaxID=35572 RepID=A0A9Q0N1K0_9DIPT|nr:Cytochrome P450, mitochondrial [Pseudolycoriella hygida]